MQNLFRQIGTKFTFLVVSHYILDSTTFLLKLLFFFLPRGFIFLFHRVGRYLANLCFDAEKQNIIPLCDNANLRCALNW